MPDPNQNPLMADLLDEHGLFRDASLHQTLAALRRKRRRNRALPTALLLLTSAFLLFQLSRPKTVPLFAPSQNPPPSVVLVRSISLPSSAIIQTAHGQIPSVTSSQGTLVTTVTVRSPVGQLTDEQLLALAGDEPVMLVHFAPGHTQLIFPAHQTAGP